MKFHPSATVGGSSAIIFLFISHPRDCSGVPTAGGREEIPTLKKTEGGKNTTCPQTSSCRLIRVRLTEISIAPPPSCSGPPLNSSHLGKTYFKHATVHQRARRVQHRAALAVTHVAATISCSLQKAAAAAAILANKHGVEPSPSPVQWER